MTRTFIRHALPFAAAMAVSFAMTPAFAHGDEGGSGGTILPAGTTRVTFGYDIARFNEISDARLKALAIQGVEEVHSLKTIGVPSATIGYGVSADFTLSVRLPYLDNQEIRETDPDAGGVAARGGVQGIGDISVAATYRVIHDEQHGFDAAIILGVKAPAGRTDVVDDLGEEFETEHQPGSGSWDGVFGATLSKELGAATVTANSTYSLSGEGSRETTLGDRLSYGIGVSYRLFAGHEEAREAMKLGGRFDGMMHHGGPGHEEHSDDHHGDIALDVSLGLNGEWQDKHETAGERDENTGGNILYVTPGMKLTVDRYSGFVNFAIPVARDLNGIQVEPDWRLSTGVSVDF